MNEGQFQAIVSRLDRLIELAEAQQQMAQASMAAIRDTVEGLSNGAELPQPLSKRAASKRSRA